MNDGSESILSGLPPWRMAPRAGTHISVAAVDPERVEALRSDLVAADGVVWNELAASKSTHFFRWALIHTRGPLRGRHTQCYEVVEDEDPKFKHRYHWLVMTSNFDGDERDHLAEIATLLGEEGAGAFATVYDACPDFGRPRTLWDGLRWRARRSWWLVRRWVALSPTSPAAVFADPVQDRVDFILDRAQPADLFYDGHLYRSVPQIHAEAALWDGLQLALDEGQPGRQPKVPYEELRPPDRPGWRPRDVRTELQHLVATDEDGFAEMLERPAYPRGPVAGALALLAGVSALVGAIGAVFLLFPWVGEHTPFSRFVETPPAVAWTWACFALLAGTFGLLFVRVFQDRPRLYWSGVIAVAVVAIGLGVSAGGLSEAARGWGFLRVGFAGFFAALLILVAALSLVALARLREIAVEQNRRAIRRPPDRSERVHRLPLDFREGRYAQNTMTHIAEVEPGRVPALRGVLAAINLASRHYYQPRLNLGGIRTIHFGYWTVLDGKRDDDPNFLLFITNYDGSFDEYLTDFAKRSTYKGVNAAWGQCTDFPSVRRVLEEGANQDVDGFLDFGRKFQVPTQVWYSAYPHLTAKQINRQSRVRLELQRKLSPERTREWIDMLAGQGGEGP